MKGFLLSLLVLGLAGCWPPSPEDETLALLKTTRVEDLDERGVIALLIKTDQSTAYCNGVLIERRVALTAAHCCVEGAKLYAIPARGAGDDKPVSIDDMIKGASLVLSCEKRDPKSEKLADDLALLKLQKIVSGAHRPAVLVAKEHLVKSAPLLDLGMIEKGRLPDLEPSAARAVLFQILPPYRLKGFPFAPLRRELSLAGFDVRRGYVGFAAESTDMVTGGTSGAPVFVDVDGAPRLLSLMVAATSQTYRVTSAGVDLRHHLAWIRARSVQ